jgi:hypothetical protein
VGLWSLIHRAFQNEKHLIDPIATLTWGNPMFGMRNSKTMKSTDPAQSLSLPADMIPAQAAWGRGKSLLLAYGFFAAGATYSWCMAWNAFTLPEGACLLAIAWFPAVIVEVFRRIPIVNPAVAAALLSGMAGYDGVLRLLRPWSGC